MLQKLASHNDDIKRLVEKGFAVAFDSGYLIIRDLPYLDDQRQLRWGAIVSKVKFIDQERVEQEDHQVFFAGGVPHGLNGAPITNLGGGPVQLALGKASADVIVERSFSNKPVPEEKFVDFFAKIESYVTIICGPAIELHKANPYTFNSVEGGADDSVFKVHDTLTSRAELTDLAAKFKNDVVAVIGLGGTGAYVLDLLAKTPVKAIKGFDGDVFHVHNAFRSPGRLDIAEFGQSKADVYVARYDNFRHGLSFHSKYVDASCAADLDGVTFAFVCVDKGSSRAEIFDLLIAKKIPFIDVGMGLKRKNGAISGMARVTYYSVENAPKLLEKRLAEVSDDPDDIYKTNIQIGELNALNACLAILRFKQLRGFYVADASYYHLLFELDDLMIVSESDEPDEN